MRRPSYNYYLVSIPSRILNLWKWPTCLFTSIRARALSTRLFRKSFYFNFLVCLNLGDSVDKFFLDLESTDKSTCLDVCDFSKFWLLTHVLGAGLHEFTSSARGASNLKLYLEGKRSYCMGIKSKLWGIGKRLQNQN